MQDRPENDDVLDAEEEAAAEEAGEIGGRSGMEGMDEAERAVAEHGGGEAEGFEEAEKLLQGQASHRDRPVSPEMGASRAEPDEDPSVHGEADEVDSTETSSDTEGTHRDG